MFADFHFDEFLPLFQAPLLKDDPAESLCPVVSGAGSLSLGHGLISHAWATVSLAMPGPRVQSLCSPGGRQTGTTCQDHPRGRVPGAQRRKTVDAQKGEGAANGPAARPDPASGTPPQGAETSANGWAEKLLHTPHLLGLVWRC